MNVWERLSALPGLGLGWLAVDTLTPTSWAGEECFCTRGTWSCRAVSWLLAQRHTAESVRSKELKLSSERASLNCWPEHQLDRFASPLTFWWNTEWGTGALAQGLLVPVHRIVSRFRGTSQSHLLFSWFDQVLGVWMTPESTRPVEEETRKLGAEHREASCCSPHCQASISGRQRYLRSSHIVSSVHLLPAGRESQSRGWPGTHGLIRNPRLLLANGGSPGVSGVKYWPSCCPDWSICL